MADPVSLSSMSPVIASETIAANVIRASQPAYAMLGLLHTDSINGINTTKKRYPVSGAPGMAGAGSPGVRVGITTQPSFASSVEVTPSEAAVDQIAIDWDALQVPNGINSDQVMSWFQSLPIDILLRAMEFPVSWLTQRRMTKIEDECLSLIDGISESVNDLTTDLSFADLLEAIFQLDENEPTNSNRAFILANKHFATLRTEAYVTGGGLSASLLFQRTDYSMVTTTAQLPDAYVGNFMDIPAYRMAPSLNRITTSGGNTGLAGALIVPGWMTAPDAMGGKPGFGVIVEGTNPQYAFQNEIGDRAINLLLRHKFAVAELQDGAAIRILSND